MRLTSLAAGILTFTLAGYPAISALATRTLGAATPQPNSRPQNQNNNDDQQVPDDQKKEQPAPKQ